MSSAFPSFLLLPRPFPLLLVCRCVFVFGRLTSTSNVCLDTQTRAHTARAHTFQKDNFTLTSTFLFFFVNASLLRTSPPTVGQRKKMEVLTLLYLQHILTHVHTHSVSLTCMCAHTVHVRKIIYASLEQSTEQPQETSKAGDRHAVHLYTFHFSL